MKDNSISRMPPWSLNFCQFVLLLRDCVILSLMLEFGKPIRRSFKSMDFGSESISMSICSDNIKSVELKLVVVENHCSGKVGIVGSLCQDPA